MALDMDNPPNDKPNGDEPRRQSIDEFVEEHLTQGRLNDIWDRLQGVGTRGGSPAQKYGWADFLGDCCTTLKVTRWLHKLGAAAAVAGAALVVFLLVRPSEWAIRTPSAWQSASGVRLPDTLRFRLGSASAALSGPLYDLAGRLGGGSRAGNNVTVLDATFSGTNEAGLPVTFRGSLILTNAPGVVNVRRRGDFTGATLEGTLTVGTNVTSVSQPFAAN